MKKSWSVLQRDLKIALKDPMALWMVIMPLVLAVVILMIAPGISETTLNLAAEEAIGEDVIETLSAYASVETLADADAVEERVMRRDEVIGLVLGEDGITIVRQGNETETTLTLSQLLVAMAENGTDEADTSSISYLSFRDETSPLKRAFSITLLLMIGVIMSMLISLGLVDEKADQTIKAANVTPIRQSVYVLSKSLIGVIALLFTSVAALLILGMIDINWGQILLMIVANALISIIVAFLIGLSSTDFIEAAGSVKMLMFPLIASVLVYELVDNTVWHITVMWSPFYWAYRGITEIIQGTSAWGSTLLYAGIILAISGIVFKLCLKGIRKSLN